MKFTPSSTNEDNVFRVHISPLNFDRKPKGHETDIYRNMSTSDNYSLDTVIEAIETGHAIIPAQLSNYGDNPFEPLGEYFTAQQQFMLDVDSNLKDGIIAPEMDRTLDTLCSLGITPAFAYPTFSHKEEAPKYRIAVISDRKIMTDFERQVIFNCFMEIIGKQGRKYFMDRSTFNRGRMFFGTNKQVKVLDTSARISLEGILDIVEKFLHDKGALHCNSARLLKEFASRIGYEYDKNKGLYLPNNDSISENGNVRNCINNNIYTNSDVSNSFQYGRLKIPFEKLLDTCILVRNLQEGVDLSHSDRIRVMSNMLLVEGGEKLYIHLIREKHYRQYRISTQPDYEVKSWKRNKGSAVGCKDCTFFEECNPTGNNILNSIVRYKGAKVRLLEQVQTVSLEYVRGTNATEGSLEYHLNNCIELGEVNIIRADCGIGKTYYIQKYDNAIIATLTNKVCLQIVEDRKNLGLDTVYFPDLSEYYTPRIKTLHSIGAVNEANIEIRKLAKEYRDIPQGKRTKGQQEYIDYVDAFQRLKNEDTTAVMTIDRLLNLGEDFGRSVYFDENPLMKLKQVIPVKYEVIDILRQQFLEFPIPAVKKVIEAVANKLETFDISKEERKELVNYAHELSQYNANIFHLINADKVLYTPNRIVCHRYRNIPSGTVTVLSGTLQEDFAELVLQRKINYFDLGNIGLKGEIIMYMGNSYSRKKVKETLESIAEYRSLIQTHKDCNFVVHKEFEILLEEEGIPRGRIMHFGGTEGRNDFIGKDLCVIGTPYVHPDTVRDYAWCIGYDCPEKITPRYQKVQFGGYEFFETTFDDKVLRTIHLQMIYEQLVQAVYRARPIDNDCKVYVYSAFPIMGTKIKT
jgi:hypothetical protein